MKTTLYFDGLCEPVNPGGVMSWGWLLVGEAGLVIGQGYDARPRHPDNTNNVAEWFALGCALRALAEHPEKPTELEIHGDSKLVICQLTGEWACHKPRLGDLCKKCRDIIEKELCCKWTAGWIPREQNEEADELSRQGYMNLTGKEPPTRVKLARRV
jgi:ribonuclease HI